VKKRVVVCGLGTVGAPTASYVKRRGFEVYGYDIKPVKLPGIKVYTDYDDVPPVETVVVTVWTGWRNNRPDLDAISDVCKKAAAKDRETLICIESTVPPGTCTKLAGTHHFRHLVHVPHRYWPSNPSRYGVKQKRVIGGVTPESLVMGLGFYKALRIPLHVCPSVEVAELCKIAENADRYVQIAYAQELRRICEEIGVEIKAVREACNTKWNVNLLDPRDGIKGDCLPLSVQLLRSLSPKSLPFLEGALVSNEEYISQFSGR